MGKATWVNVGGTWKQVKNVWENVGDVWKSKVIPKTNVAGTWKDCMQYNLYNVALSLSGGQYTEYNLCYNKFSNFIYVVNYTAQEVYRDDINLTPANVVGNFLECLSTNNYNFIISSFIDDTIIVYYVNIGDTASLLLIKADGTRSGGEIIPQKSTSRVDGIILNRVSNEMIIYMHYGSTHVEYKRQIDGTKIPLDPAKFIPPTSFSNGVSSIDGQYYYVVFNNYFYKCSWSDGSVITSISAYANVLKVLNNGNIVALSFNSSTIYLTLLDSNLNTIKSIGITVATAPLHPGIQIDKDDNIYVFDVNNSNVGTMYKYDKDFNYIWTLTNIPGVCGYLGSNMFDIANDYSIFVGSTSGSGINKYVQS